MFTYTHAYPSIHPSPRQTKWRVKLSRASERARPNSCLIIIHISHPCMHLLQRSHRAVRPSVRRPGGGGPSFSTPARVYKERVRHTRVIRAAPLSRGRSSSCECDTLPSLSSRTKLRPVIRTQVRPTAVALIKTPRPPSSLSGKLSPRVRSFVRSFFRSLHWPRTQLHNTHRVVAVPLLRHETARKRRRERGGESEGRTSGRADERADCKFC